MSLTRDIMSNTSAELFDSTQSCIVVVILILEALTFLCIGIVSHNKKYKKSVERALQQESNLESKICNDIPIKKVAGCESPMSRKVALGDSPMSISETPKTHVGDSDELDFAMDDFDMEDDSDLEVSTETLESMNLVSRVPVCLSSIAERSDEERSSSDEE